MAITPYLKPFNDNGGTLYVFPSVSQDLTRTFVSSDYEFKFSHFACLNIPDIVIDTEYSEDSDSDPSNDLPRGLYLNTLKQPNDWSINTGNLGRAITEHLQNYVMNFETAILNGDGDNDDYDSDILTTVSEKVFWNWMRKIGAIKFTDNNSEEDYDSYRDRVVQYIGNLDVMNTVEINGDTFEELYIHVPSTAGASTKVYFRTGAQTDNKNYLNKNYTITNPADTTEYIIGRKESDKNPYDNAMTIKSFVDIEDGNLYSGDIGHTIDFRDSVYTDGINGMNNKSYEDFEFNAVLIYYDLTQKTTTPGVKRTATNLYGILFLEEPRANGGKYYIQRYPKKKETVYGNGNSYALKLDLKIDTVGDTTYQINDSFTDPNTAYSMSLYTRAMEHLQKCIDMFYTQRTDIVKLTERVEQLENLVLGIDTVAKLREDISRLYTLFDGNAAVDTSTLLGLIDENAKKLNGIINGEKNLKLQYDLDVLQPGRGIGLVKSPNKVVINSEDKYAVNLITDDDGVEINSDNPLSSSAPTKNINMTLDPGENLAVIYVTNDGLSEGNIYINVDDTNYDWSVGQSLKIFFTLDSGYLGFNDGVTNGIVIRPNKNNRNISIDVKGSDFEGNNCIEVICVGENKFIHLIR